MTPQVTQATMPLLIMIMGKMFENKTENPFSLKDCEREMTILTIQCDKFDNPLKNDNV